AVEQAADGRHTRVYLNEGTLVTLQVAKSRTAQVAAANWHALARFAGRFTMGRPALLIDVGSTTCDVIPLLNGEPATNQRTDTARLLRGELIYAGVERTPVCSLVSSLPYRGHLCPVAREFFATTRDAYTLLGKVPERPMSRDTPDGRAVTKAASRLRLARMICADIEDFNHRDAGIAAEAVANALTKALLDGVQQVIAAYSFEPTIAVLSGHGAFAAKKALEQADLPWERVFLASEIGGNASRCAPAHALAVLAREASGG
ncbi:MAG TPA: hydantoinase/oxoprolinase family protein, partial [Pirellulaceae bacterium]|nr:hydantoinase/oxoprolinase family protein [Pirellulaceae bacterium]